MEFTLSPYDELLTGDQRALLKTLHPEGAARFWGATGAHDKKFADVTTGDVVLFTGRGQVRAIGEVGAIFRNQALADLLWPPQAGGPSWHTVYSLTDLVPATIPYEELNSVLGYSPAHSFPGQMVLRGDRARAVLEDFMITPSTGTGVPEPPAAETAARPDPVRIAAMEELRTHRTGYRRTGRLVVVDRREARLVRAYRLFLADQSLTARRFFCPSGISDMYLETAEGGEVIEAKSEAGHRHVRQALAQLLDYAPYSPSTVHRLIALFPEAPDRDDMRFLHRYGVDCVHREPAGGFVRTPAPAQRRALMRSLWSDAF
ncbi:hypothetical protein [Streptomyces sp. P10-4]|uniref:hypothetical protein n=1 Tax=Streptomyces sp. P10-4 TaxID=3421645 RepID=UPI003D2E08F5